MVKKKKRKPHGYWKDLKNQKAFLDSLLRKYKIPPENIRYKMIRENGGQVVLQYYKNTLELLETHYCELCLLDIPKVPKGTWKKKKFRIRAVHQAMERLIKRPDRVRAEDFERVGLQGLLEHGGLWFHALLREAGYDVPDPVSWKSWKVRVKKIRELVEKTGGVERITLKYIEKKARGLIEYYEGLSPRSSSKSKKRKKSSKGKNGSASGEALDYEHGTAVRFKKRDWKTERGGMWGNLDPGQYIPTLYWILNDAGYDVTPEDCIRGLNSPENTPSLHGHMNHSVAEAVIDDWIYEIVGERHQHDILYPGQKKSQYDCDFLLLPTASDGWRLRPVGAYAPEGVASGEGKLPGKAGARTQAKACGYLTQSQQPNWLPDPNLYPNLLWVEYAGLLSNRKTKLAESYRQKMQKKKAMAEKAELLYIVITPENIKHPHKLWEEMVYKAGWLRKYEKRALASKFLNRLSE